MADLLSYLNPAEEQEQEQEEQEEEQQEEDEIFWQTCYLISTQ